ncbi:MAG: DinB family protein [Calditrichia bacterium]
MTPAQELLAELILEAEVTRSYLEKVPFNEADFQPHKKSEKLGRLAIHVAEIIGWWKECVAHDHLDFIDFEPEQIKTTSELLAYFDKLLGEAKETLNKATDADFDRQWSMRYGDEVLFTLPKKQVIRIFCMNHLIHHRAQLGVYLRLLDIEIPATYGPSADDENVILVQEFSKRV